MDDNRTKLDWYYAKAKERGLVEAEALRLEVSEGTSPKLGVNVRVLLDFQCLADEKTTTKRYVYGASLLFSRLTLPTYQSIAQSAVNEHGPGKQAADAVARLLLKRDDIVAVYFDQRIMSHPVITREIGALRPALYPSDGSSVGEATREAIYAHQAELTRALTWDNLDRGVHPSRRPFPAASCGPAPS